MYQEFNLKFLTWIGEKFHSKFHYLSFFSNPLHNITFLSTFNLNTIKEPQKHFLLVVASNKQALYVRNNGGMLWVSHHPDSNLPVSWIMSYRLIRHTQPPNYMLISAAFTRIIGIESNSLSQIWFLINYQLTACKNSPSLKNCCEHLR